MALNLNLCTSVLPNFSFEDAVEIAASAKFHGVELRVNDHNHVSLKQLENEGLSIRRQLDYAGLQVPVLNSYIPVSDRETVEQLIRVSQTMGVPKARVVLPRSCHATVSRQSKIKEIIPSYETLEEPETLFNHLKTTLHSLEHKAEKAGVKLLLELHWGTVMSSFSSAYLLTHDLNPDCIAITFDPANMMVERKEKNHHLAKSISDSEALASLRPRGDAKGERASASWYQFTQWLQYFAKVHGVIVIAVPPHNTTVDCSCCGAKVKKTLSTRTHRCSSCGTVLDRDHNAAKNILAKGFKLLAEYLNSTVGHTESGAKSSFISGRN